MVDLAELKAMIEAALPGATVKVLDEDGGGRHLRAEVTAGQFAGLRGRGSPGRVSSSCAGNQK